MSPYCAAGFIALAITGLLGCSHPDKSPPTQKAVAESTTISDQVLLNPQEFYVNDPVLIQASQEFTSRHFKELAKQCWYYYGVQKCMVLFTKDGSGSHASSADIGGFFAEYAAKTQKWAVTAQSLSFTQNGSWGEAPTPHFVKLGPEKYGFLMESSYTQGGYTNSHTTLYGIIGSSFVEMLNLPTYDGNGAATEDPSQSYSVTVNLYQIVDSHKDFYDLKAELVIDGNYDYLKDESYGKLFAKSKSVNIPFQNGAYVIHSGS